MGVFKKPTQEDLLNPASFARFVLPQQSYAGSTLPRTTASIRGASTYGATSFNVSDILQGTFAVKDQSDQLLILNQAATKDLAGLYDIGADSLSAYGTRGTAPALSGGNAGVSNGPGGQVKESWVTSLPKTHPVTKAFLWVSNGKGSREMHLGTSDNIQTDTAQHKQLSNLPDSWKHPWNMDRIGGAVGGEAKIYTDVKSASSILGESAGIAGLGGAFGYLTPEEEQWYISMAWPTKNSIKDFEDANEPTVVAIARDRIKADYRGRRILVYSVEKKTAVVCTPGDYGPRPKWTNSAADRKAINGFIAGLSPDVHFALGTDHGAEIRVGWMPDETPLGPYAPTADQSEGGGVVNGNISGVGGTVSTAVGNVSIDDLKFASLKILNHPNCWMGRTGQRVPGQQVQYAQAFTTHMTKGNTSGWASEVVFKGTDGKQWLFPSLLNYMWYILEAGFILDYYAGSIVHKQKSGDSSVLSNHATGGAIDINLLGLASEGKVYAYSDAKNYRRIADKMFNFLATLPENTRANEIGCSFGYTYPNNFKVFKDTNPTHVHLAFTTKNTGTLLPKLRASSTSQPTGFRQGTQ